MGKKKDFNLEDFKQEVKQKENNMKTPNNTVRTALTVFITLVVVAAFAGTFYLGMNYQKNQDNTIKREAISLSEQMATSKTNQ
jgi:hypothetical protein